MPFLKYCGLSSNSGCSTKAPSESVQVQSLQACSRLVTTKYPFQIYPCWKGKYSENCLSLISRFLEAT
jgi:hypothetical protein